MLFKENTKQQQNERPYDQNDTTISVCSMFLKELHDDSDLDKQEYNVALMKIEENGTTEYFRGNIIRNYEKVSDVEYSICLVKTQYEVNRDDFEKQRTIWHQRVEDIFDQLGSLNQSLKDKNMGILTCTRQDGTF